MRVSLKRASPADLECLIPLVLDYYRFEGIAAGRAHVRKALRRLLRDRSLGAVWLIRYGGEPAGYIVLCFGYSLEFGGRDAFLDEFFVVPGCRGRGVGRQALALVLSRSRSLRLTAISLEVGRANRRAVRLYHSLGFKFRDKYRFMSRPLRVDPADR